MNDTQEILEKISKKTNKIRTLNILLTDLINASKLELLEEKTKEAIKPIIKDVEEKLDEVSRQ